MAEMQKTKASTIRKEQTGIQVSTTYGTDTLMKIMPASYETYRTIRKHPTIAMTRSLINATVIAGEWSIGADKEIDKDRVRAVHDAILPWRSTILQHAIFGGVDFGWAPFEIIWKDDDGLVSIAKVKPLLQDLTTILIEKDTGALRGYRQRSLVMGDSIDVMLEYVLHVAFRVEGTDWHGEALLEYARGTYNKWIDADAGAARYDKKVAGSHFVIYYPLGESLYDGTMTDNADIAKVLLRALESSGSVMVPDQLTDYVAGDENRPKWRIELLSDTSARQPSFVDRLKYLDALMVRALLVPERSILEGKFGTKAEASAHAEMAIVNLQQLDETVVDMVNKQVIDQMLVRNWGEEARGTIRLEAAPLTSEQILLLKAVYEKVLTNPQGFLEEIERIDTDAIKDQLGVPRKEEEEPADITEEVSDEEAPEDDARGPGDVPAPGAARDQLSLLSGHRVRIRDDATLTLEPGGLVDEYGPDLAMAEDTFQRAARLASFSLFDEARKLLSTIPRPSDFNAHRTVQLRVAREMARFLELETKGRRGHE